MTQITAKNNDYVNLVGTMEIFAIIKGALKKKIDEGSDFVLIDTLGEESYKRRHLPEAISIDAHKDDFVERVKEIVPDKDKEIIVYCASFSCQLSPAAAGKLIDAEYTNVVDYEGGLADWQDAGYPFEGEGSNLF